MSGFKRKRGFRSMDNPAGPKENDYWDAMLEKLDKPVKGKPQIIRPVAGVMTVVTHFLRFMPRGGVTEPTGFQVLCPNWDIAEGTEKDGGCSICADFHKNIDVSEKYKWLKMPPSYRYLFHAFNVTALQNGMTEGTFGLVEANILAWREIESMRQVMQAPVDHPTKGSSLYWLAQDSTNPFYKGTEYKFQRAEKQPVKLKDEEQGLWLIKVNGKVHKGVIQDVLARIPDPDPDVITQKLRSLGVYDALSKATGVSYSGTVSSSKSSVPDDFDDDDVADVDDPDMDDTLATDMPDDFDEEPEEKPKSKKTKPTKTKKQAAKKGAAKKKKKKPEPEPEEEDLDEDLGGDDDFGSEDSFDDELDSDGGDDNSSDDFGDDDADTVWDEDGTDSGDGDDDDGEDW